MKFLWCDTETTGLETVNAKPFQIAFIFCYSLKVPNEALKQEVFERVFTLNPFDIPGTEYNESAGKVNGYTKEMIQEFKASAIAVKDIEQYLTELLNYKQTEKMFFCGYNSNTFDWNHLVDLFARYELDFTKFFNTQKLDVFEQVKRAGQMKILPYLENRKLTTVAKFLNIEMENAHDALCDIRATREVAKSLTRKGVALN